VSDLKPGPAQLNLNVNIVAIFAPKALVKVYDAAGASHILVVPLSGLAQHNPYDEAESTLDLPAGEDFMRLIDENTFRVTSEVLEQIEVMGVSEAQRSLLVELGKNAELSAQNDLKHTRSMPKVGRWRER
jgi:hypothetical protein